MSARFFSEKYQDIYCNPHDPEGEKQFVFVEANRIAQRIKSADRFIVAELGFGYGINHRLTIAAARKVDAEAKLQYFSCDESLPVPSAVRVYAGDVSDFMDHLLSQPELRENVDAWYFDGFSPAKNPRMWSAEIFLKAFELTKPGGTFSTYTSAGWVRRNLAAAGFEIEKVPGFGGKREMLRGFRKST